uniref:RRM domain-containing protein n=1 Tax=Rhabditophanes sp. KR3021 TaxID=114890 RepID=A0AC35TR80_9BILA
MVKLFVGNLSEKVDSHRLRNLFLEHDVNVQECDVLKNYAFVHVSNEEDAERLIQKFNNYTLEGRQLSIERSTSKLRKDPGMSDKCFTCGACDHKTPNCPCDHPTPLGAIKRPYVEDFNANNLSPHLRHTGSDNGSEPKRPNTTNNNIVRMSDPVKVNQSNGQYMNPVVNDPEFAPPPNNDLRPLYDSYIESRAQYFYFKEKYQKEMQRISETSKTPTLIYDLTGRGTAARKYEPPASAVPFTNVATNFANPPPNFAMPPPTRQVVVNLQMPAPGPYGKPPVQVQNPIGIQPSIVSSFPGGPNFSNPPPNFNMPPPTRQLSNIPPIAATANPYGISMPNALSNQISMTTTQNRQRLYNCNNGIFGCIPAREQPKEPAFGNVTPEEAQRLHLINAYRRYGYLKADLNPLDREQLKVPPVHELNPAIYGIDATCTKEPESEKKSATIVDMISHLDEIYCGKIGAEFMHLQSWEERSFFASEFERLKLTPIDNQQKKVVAELMLKSQNFDNFLGTKLSTLKRYGAEGSESMFGFFHEIFNTAPFNDISDIILCKAHRGRLNLLTELMEFPVVQMFRKIKGKPEFPENVDGSGDVLSHLTSSFDIQNEHGSVHITMLPNPSHLEAVNPVAMGKARGRAATLRVGEYADQNKSASTVGDHILCVQVHGDGAFSGQGIVWESLAMSNVPHYRVGGSVHLVVNNQIAFTAESRIGRSTKHPTDMAKGIDCPIIHVNGDSPEDVIRAARLAVNYRQKFRKDVFVNMISFRRWGHNELDDPSMTQPLMYDIIEARDSVPDEFSEKLIYEGIYTEEERDALIKAHTAHLQDEFKKADTEGPVAKHLEGNWKGFVQAPKAVTKWDTGFDVDHLRFIGAASVKVPENFAVHQHLKKMHLTGRINKIEKGEGIDFGTAEALAFGSILAQGFDVRISGQDVGRATFAHRHAMLVDQNTDEIYVPLNNMSPDQTHFIELANSLLSEEAVLGFEYGYSIESPNRLSISEMQFGDFFNGAQIQIDTFIASGESKWLTQSGLVMLLPHGYDGAGPEHSTCRMERFLQLVDSKEDQLPVDGDNVNMWVANPTTPAQYFHLLRRQVITNYRKPLIVVGPKVLLRHPKAQSTFADMAPGTHFLPLIDDVTVEKSKVKKVVFVSGKHAYALVNERDTKQIKDVAIVRVESLCPLPISELQKIKAAYPSATKFVWSQEEPRNGGAWSFVNPRFENAVGIKLQYAGRRELAWTATAIGQHHAKEHQDVLDDTFAL